MDKEYIITDGFVEYRHTKPLGDYHNKAPAVHLTFTVAEGADPHTVTEKVMGMAIEIVERAIATNVTVVQAAEQVQEPVEIPPTPRRGRPPKSATVEPVSSDVAPTGPSPSLVSEDDAEPALTLRGDIQPLAQKVSAYLRKDNGNINALREVIKECGATSLLTIEPAKFPLFIEKAKALLS